MIDSRFALRKLDGFVSGSRFVAWALTIALAGLVAMAPAHADGRHGDHGDWHHGDYHHWEGGGHGWHHDRDHWDGRRHHWRRGWHGDDDGGFFFGLNLLWPSQPYYAYSYPAYGYGPYYYSPPPVVAEPPRPCRRGLWRLHSGRIVQGIACLQPNGTWQLEH